MKKSYLASLAFAGIILAAHHPASAQTTSPPADSQALDQNVDLMRKDIRSEKKQLIAANVKLTDAEATAVWPIYDRYTADLSKISDAKYELVKEYAKGYDTLTDAQADDMVKRVLKLDGDLVALRVKYQPQYRKVLPARTAALFQQVERQTQMMIDTRLALEMPLVQP